MGKLALGDWSVREDEIEMDRDLSMHKPVLLDEVVTFLASGDGIYVDATLGGGGHARAILDALGPGGRLIGLDRDPEAVDRTRRRLLEYGARFRAQVGSFADLGIHLGELGVTGVRGIVADLGLSSDQLGDPERGFAFSYDGPLDMRFDRSQGPSAADLVNELDADQIADILWEYGEERRSRAIARRIVSRRPIRTTRELRAAVVSVLGPRRRGADPATRTFQALRIAVNQELAALSVFLEQAPGLLAPGGRLAVIAYHSLEDRAVKLRFRELGREEDFAVLTKKPVAPERQAVVDNPRARSAKLRVLQRLS